MEDLFKNAVEDIEGKATLSMSQKDKLWSRVKEEHKTSTLLLWKIACAILLLLSSGLLYLLFDSQEANQLLSQQVMQVESTLAKSSSLNQPKALEIIERDTLTQTVVDTVFQSRTEYVYREKIIYKTVEKSDALIASTDSLLMELKKRDSLIAALNFKETTKPETAEIGNTPLEVAFQQNEDLTQDLTQKEGKIKFQLSFINIK